MLYNLKFYVKIDKPYFARTIKNIFNDRFIKYKYHDFISCNEYDNLWKISENDEHYDYYCNTEQKYETIYNYTLSKINKIVFYIKNINPEFGNEWTVDFYIIEINKPEEKYNANNLNSSILDI